MLKKKRILNHFTNWLFEEYKVPRIPVRILYDCDFVVDQGVDCYGYYGPDKGETCIIVAAKRIGCTKCLFVIAHEFVHYLQQHNGWDMDDVDFIEENAYFYEAPLVGKYLNNKKHLGDRIDTVLPILPR